MASLDKRLARIDKRLTTLAHRLGVCPQHGCRLFCPSHGWRWVGTEAELEECLALMDSLEPWHQRLCPSDQRCPRCQDPLWCEACAVEAVSAIEGPEERLTPEAYARYQALLALMQPD
jgi:hypothetical protein